MSDPATVAAAFDHAVRQVDRALREGMRTLRGADAALQLEALRAQLVAERAASVARGAVDAGWIGETVRAVAAWTPEDDLTLLGALGAIARLRDRAAER
jgi:hypothetical protein